MHLAERDDPATIEGKHGARALFRAAGLGEQAMTYNVRSIVWIVVYLLFVLLPLFALLAGSLPPARGFWTEFSAALGYSGLAIMGLQFELTARFKYVTEPWGEDVIYHFHRNISLFAVALVLVHPSIMFVVHPELFAFPQDGELPWGAVFAFLSVFALLALVVTALWRVKLNISYETWHLTHIALAIIAVTGGLLHMVGWSFYLADPWKRTLWIGLTIFWFALVFYVRLVKPLFMLRRPYRITEVRQERGDTTTLVMRPEGHPGFPLQRRPVRLADGVGKPVQDHGASVLVLVQRNGDGRPCRDVDPQARRLHPGD